MVILQFILFFSLPWCTSPRAGVPVLHDLKMSVCEIAWVPESETFEVKFYLFEDDLKVTLYPLMHEGPVADKDASSYIMQHFSVQANGQPLPLTFTSMREKNDQILVQFSSPKIPAGGLQKLQVQNDLLTEKFRRQVNMVYVYYPDKDTRQTEMLDATKARTEFSF
jgi:uncharacterized protein DUF6702